MGQSQIQIPATFTKYDTESDLPKDVRHLMSHARQIRLQAYAPYSSFLVGVAMLLDNGKIILGIIKKTHHFHRDHVQSAPQFIMLVLNIQVLRFKKCAL